MNQNFLKKSFKTSIMIRNSSWRRLKVACLILRRNRLNLSENYIIQELLEQYLMAFRGKPQAALCPRRYNLADRKYVRRSAYLKRKIYLAAWQRASHSGESVSRMVDFAIRNFLPRVLANLLRVMPMTYYETKNSEYWRRRWYLRTKPRPGIFLNYSELTTKTIPAGQEWIQKTIIDTSQEPDLPPWNTKSCYARLYYGENAIYTPP